MRVLSLDFEPLFGDDDDTISTFDSDVSVFDFDVVIWDPEASLENYHAYSTYKGAPSLGDDESARFKSDVERRKVEFTDFVDSGRHLIVTARPAQKFYVATGEVTTSGTGRNAARTRMVNALDITSAIPYCSSGFATASGSRIATVGSGPLQEHIKRFTKQLRYTTTISSPPGTPLATVAGTDRVIASLLRTESGGSLTLLPSTVFEATWSDDGETETWPDEASAHEESLLLAVASLGDTGEVERPTWAEHFTTKKQQDASIDIAKQEQSIERARKKLSTLRSTKSRLDMRDQLYLGTGRVLELQVKEVLELLGGKITEPEPGRDDWRVDFDGRQATVEIKGVSKSSAEKHAAQLEKWVAGALADTEVHHKGILVVNTWRAIPLSSRTEDDFPTQMIPYSTSRNHALITGLDLFVIAAEVEANPERAEFWRRAILEVSGRLAGVPDWRDFIQETLTASSEGS